MFEISYIFRLLKTVSTYYYIQSKIEFNILDFFKHFLFGGLFSQLEFSFFNMLHNPPIKRYFT